MLRTKDLFYHLFRPQLAVIQHRAAHRDTQKAPVTQLVYPILLSCFLTTLFVALIPPFLLSSLLQINNLLLITFSPLVSILLHLYPVLAVLISCPGSFLLLMMSQMGSPQHCWPCRSLLPKRSQCSPSTACDIWLFLICFSLSHLCNCSAPYAVICHVQQFLMSCLVVFLQL